MRSEGKAKAGASAGCREAVEFYNPNCSEFADRRRFKYTKCMGLGVSPENLYSCHPVWLPVTLSVAQFSWMSIAIQAVIIAKFLPRFSPGSK
jgi:hypothetical protein